MRAKVGVVPGHMGARSKRLTGLVLLSLRHGATFEARVRVFLGLV